MIKNPFPGPQPYRSSDRDRFFGRQDLAHKLAAVILATRCITVHGPSGAGKSSLVQAAVLPSLIDDHDVRTVRVDGWPEGEEPARWFANAMYTSLRLGEVSTDIPPGEAILAGAKRAARSSPRLVIVYLDQIEQLFYTGRTIEETEPFFACLQDMAELPLRSIRIILSLREDYLGRFRDRLRDRGRILDNTFRVGPMNVAELSAAVCQAAASGMPPQTWPESTMRTLMLQVRLPGQAPTDEAEAQSAYAQIVCRALFQQRAQGEGSESDAVEAEPILRRYLEDILEAQGELRGAAQRLLEDHLVGPDGTRTLRTEKELLRIFPQNDLLPVLKALEGAAILHAEEHQGSRYFEIGHDWLARKVFEQRQEREQQAEELRRQKEAAEHMAKIRRQRRTYAIIAGASIAGAVVTSALGLLARRAQHQAEEAQKQAALAHLEAVRKRIEANDQRTISGFLSLSSQGAKAQALKLLPEVEFPAQRAGWLSYASDALSENMLRSTLKGHDAPLSTAVFSPDGKHVLTASHDGTARVWNADGTGEALVLQGHAEAVLSAAYSPDGSHILTTSEDGTARVWGLAEGGKSIELKVGQGFVNAGAFSPDGKSVLLGGADGVARIFQADGSGSPVELGGPGDRGSPINDVAFFPDGQRVATASDDQRVRVWTLNTKTPPLQLKDHKGAVRSLKISPDGTKVLTTSGENVARLFAIEGKTVRPPRLFSCDKGEAVRAVLSPDATLVALACSDKVARVFSIAEKDQAPKLFDGAGAGLSDVSFRPDGKFLATASLDYRARIYSIHGTGLPIELGEHRAKLGSVAWSPDGKSLVTAVSDDRAADHSAKIWSAQRLNFLKSALADEQMPHSTTYSPDGTLFAAAYDDNTARSIPMDEKGDATPVVFNGHTAWITHVARSPKGDRLLTASLDKSVRVWNADGPGDPILLKDEAGGGIYFAAFSPDGKRVLTAGEDKTAKVWDVEKPDAPILSLTGHEDWVISAAFSPDGKRVATTSYDHTVRVFMADGSGPPVVLEGHRGPVNTAAFDPEGKRIVTASDDGTVRVWNADGTGTPLVFAERISAAMLLAVWSDNGKHIAAGSRDGLVFVWSTESRGRPSVLKASQPAEALVFLDHDQTLLAVLADHTSHLWKVDVQALMTELKAAHADCLLPDIRVQYLDESLECARNAFALCESSHGRQKAPETLAQCGEDPDIEKIRNAPGLLPIPTGKEAGLGTGANPETAKAPRRLKDLGADGRRAVVVVLPGDASVEISGNIVSRRHGLIELMGKKGDVFKLRVSKVGEYLEQDVVLTDTGASPALVDLNPKIVAKYAPKEKKALKPGEGDFSALLGAEDN